LPSLYDRLCLPFCTFAVSDASSAVSDTASIASDDTASIAESIADSTAPLIDLAEDVSVSAGAVRSDDLNIRSSTAYML
jgi:hypothetical protein